MTLQKFEVDSDDKVIIKDQAYTAAGRLVQNNLNLTGVDKERYLSNNFKKVWDHYDKNSKGIITEAESRDFF